MKIKTEPIYDRVDIVLTKVDDKYNISILNCDDFKKLQEIKKFYKCYYKLQGIQKKEIVKIGEEKPVIMKQGEFKNKHLLMKTILILMII